MNKFLLCKHETLGSDLPPCKSRHISVPVSLALGQGADTGESQPHRSQPARPPGMTSFRFSNTVLKIKDEKQLKIFWHQHLASTHVCTSKWTHIYSTHIYTQNQLFKNSVVVLLKIVLNWAW